MSNKRLRPYAKVFQPTLASLYGHLVHCLLGNALPQSPPCKGFRYGAVQSDSTMTMIDLFPGDVETGQQTRSRIGFDWSGAKRPEDRVVAGLTAGFVRVLAFALVKAFDTGSLVVQLTELEVLRFAGIQKKGNGWKGRLSQLLLMLERASFFEAPRIQPVKIEDENGRVLRTDYLSLCKPKRRYKFRQVEDVFEFRFSTDGAATKINETEIDGHCRNLGVSELLVARFRDSTDSYSIDSSLTKEQAILLGLNAKIKGARVLEWSHRVISAPRLLHSADLRLNSQEEALYCWIERELTLAGSGSQSYKVWTLDGYAGEWYGALSNHKQTSRSQGPAGIGLRALVRNSYFPINDRSWTARKWYKALRDLLDKLGGVLLLKFPEGELCDAKDWETLSDYHLDRVKLFPFLPTSWLETVNANFAEFRTPRPKANSDLVTYKNVQMGKIEALDQKRKDLGLSRLKLGGILGVSPYTIRAWERGERGLSNPKALKWIQDG